MSNQSYISYLHWINNYYETDFSLLTLITGGLSPASSIIKNLSHNIVEENVDPVNFEQCWVIIINSDSKQIIKTAEEFISTSAIYLTSCRIHYSDLMLSVFSIIVQGLEKKLKIQWTQDFEV